ETVPGVRRLRVGQLIFAEVAFPMTLGEVVLPAAALVRQGQDYQVFVQSRPGADEYVCRRVAFVRRGRASVHVRAQPTPAEALRGCKPIQPGEHVVCTGAVELAETLRKGSGRGR